MIGFMWQIIKDCVNWIWRANQLVKPSLDELLSASWRRTRFMPNKQAAQIVVEWNISDEMLAVQIRKFRCYLVCLECHRPDGYNGARNGYADIDAAETRPPFAFLIATPNAVIPFEVINEPCKEIAALYKSNYPD